MASSLSPPSPLLLSNKIQKTLDPCVVLMKDLMGQYNDLWTHRGGIYSLSQGTVYWEPPRTAIEALQQAILSPNPQQYDLHLYGPDEGLDELRTALQQKLETENNLHEAQVMITTGANQAYMNCVLTLLSQHNKAVVFAPYYFNHVMALQMTLDDDESNLLIGPTTITNNGYPDLDWLEMQLQSDAAIHVVTIVNPGNPTGILLPRQILQRAVDLCQQYQCWLILDCTYEYFGYTNPTTQNFEGCFDEPHVIHIFSFSKSYALAGYRCGYVALPANNADLYAQMLKVQDTIPIAPSRISQIAALGAMKAGRKWVGDQVATLTVGKEAILKAIAPLSPNIMGGSGAMYLMAKLPIDDDVQWAQDLVRDYGVAVIPGSFCGFPGWIRICYANLPPNVCVLAADRLAQGIQALVQKT